LWALDGIAPGEGAPIYSCHTSVASPLFALRSNAVESLNCVFCATLVQRAQRSGLWIGTRYRREIAAKNGCGRAAGPYWRDDKRFCGLAIAQGGSASRLPRPAQSSG
jgi:hypothetical protein